MSVALRWATAAARSLSRLLGLSLLLFLDLRFFLLGLLDGLVGDEGGLVEVRLEAEHFIADLVDFNEFLGSDHALADQAAVDEIGARVGGRRDDAAVAPEGVVGGGHAAEDAP